MMMRQIVASLIIALACVAFAPGSLASGASQCAQLSELISQNEDAQMTSEDLAFFLAIHNYDATPKGGIRPGKDGRYNLQPRAQWHRPRTGRPDN